MGSIAPVILKHKETNNIEKLTKYTRTTNMLVRFCHMVIYKTLPVSL